MTNREADVHLTLQADMATRSGELLELHRRLVQVPSVNWGNGSSAREDEVAAVAGAYLKPFGVEGRVASGAPGRGNFLARLNARSHDTGKTILFMSHSDVVPAGDESAWRFPPFSARVADGRIWGRGSNDCKMLVAAELFAIASLAKLGLPAEGEVRIAIGADEEAGGRWGFGWLAENEPEFLRADLAVNEGGGSYRGDSAAGERLFTIGSGEKGRYEITFTAKGPGTHASIPWGRPNPLARLGELAAALAAWEGAPALVSPVLQGLRGQLGLGGELSLANLTETIEAARRFSNSFCNSLLAQSRMTIVPTMIAAGEKSNAVPARAELQCDARILPGGSRAELESAVRAVLTQFPEVEYKIEETAAPSVSEFSSRWCELFERAISRTLDAGAPCRALPTWCTGFTDSRFVRPFGTPTFGFHLVEPGADPDRLSIHCIDESIEVTMLLPCAQALAHLALDFCSAASSPSSSLAAASAQR